MSNRKKNAAWNSWERERKKKKRSKEDYQQKEIITIADALKTWAKGRNVQKRLSEGEVLGRWREIVGDVYAEHAEPVSIQRGCLVLKVEDSNWRNELHFMQRQLIGKINAACKAKVVTKIVFTA